MKLLADENFPKQLVFELRDTGHDVLWARTDCGGCSDTRLLELAEAQARIVITLDKDFWQIALQRRVPLIRSGVVLFRVHPATSNRLQPLIEAFLTHQEVWRGQVSLVTPFEIQTITL